MFAAAVCPFCFLCCESNKVRGKNKFGMLSYIMKYKFCLQFETSTVTAATPLGASECDLKVLSPGDPISGVAIVQLCSTTQIFDSKSHRCLIRLEVSLLAVFTLSLCNVTGEFKRKAVVMGSSITMV